METVYRRSLAAQSKGMARLYEAIFDCNVCFGAPGCRIIRDPERVRRVLVPRAIESDVFIVGQALGGSTQRSSGLPYCFANGSLSQAGRRLDTFLGSLGYTIDPENPDRRYAYSSDLIQHYPGRATRVGDKKPTKAEVDNCALWLKREILLLRPRVVLLLGKTAATDFLYRYAGLRVRDMGDVWGRRYECVLEGCRVSAFPVRHFSYRFDRQGTEQARLAAANLIRATLQARPRVTSVRHGR